MEVDVTAMAPGTSNSIEDLPPDESWWSDFVGVAIVVTETS